MANSPSATMTYSSKSISNSRADRLCPTAADSLPADGQQMLPMEPEVSAAVNFLRDLMIKSSMDVTQVDRFRSCLKTVMVNHYRNHWYPKIPLRGSAYRCLRINGSLDPLVAKAASMASLSPDLVRLAFPVELSLWVDPGEVSVRFGEEGSIGVIHSCEPVMPADDDDQQQQQSVQQEPRDLRFGNSGQPLTTFNGQHSPPSINLHHHQQQQQQHPLHHGHQYGGQLEQRMLQRSPPNVRLQTADSRYTRDMMTIQRDSAWSNWNQQPDSIGKSGHVVHRHHYVVNNHPRNYHSLQQMPAMTTPYQISGTNPSPPTVQSVVDQTPPPQYAAVDAGNNSQLSRHCRALAEQLIMNGGLMWSTTTPSCGDNGQVIETVAS